MFYKVLLTLLTLTTGSIFQPCLAAWPDDQPIDLVVGFAPGGGTDLMARALAPYLEKKLGGKTRIVVVNKPGAGGEISSTYISRAKPDGYTIGFINVPGFVFTPMYRNSSYQIDDLRIIARIVDDPSVLMARKDAKFGTVPAIVAALKADPGSLSFATSGRGTTGHLSLLNIQKAAGVKGTDIAYKGAGEFKGALLGGHVNYAFASVAEFLVAKNDQVHAIAVLNANRIPALGDVPTFKELGYDIRASSERGIAAPKALPDSIATRLEAAIRDTLQDPVFLSSVKNDAPVVSYMAGAPWAASLLTIRESLKPFVDEMRE
jgi:tripartite-type tricarboxylate transporter receptor subunit TctC